MGKISDVGLVRLVPLSVADNVTQYQMTSTAGNFCYIDLEYQQTGKEGHVDYDMVSGVVYTHPEVVFVGKQRSGVSQF